MWLVGKTFGNDILKQYKDESRMRTRQQYDNYLYMFIFYTFVFYVVHNKFECESFKYIYYSKTKNIFSIFNLNKECQMLINLHQQ
jgi:hypothetical protein